MSAQKIRESGDVLLGGDVDDPGWSRLYEIVKAVDAFDLLRSGIWHNWRKKSVVWVEPMLCVLGDPKILGKNSIILFVTDL